MKGAYSRSTIESRLKATFSDPVNLKASLQDTTLPQNLLDWLNRLGLLYGVPFNYLVPDEGMLPPESIRFFYLDSNWVAALLDGASSIGRNLTADQPSPSMTLDKAIHDDVLFQVKSAAPDIRAKLFGLQGVPPVMKTITGFVLRSSLVLEYPSMGVNVFPLGHTPDDPQPQLLTILRMEQLGPKSDTLICLVSGDGYRVDVHEAPQALHYGIDSFTPADPTKGTPVAATKNVHTFGVNTSTSGGTTTQSITMSTTATPVNISTCFRPNSRVIELSTLANVILKANQTATPPPGTTTPTSIDSAGMGFEMTEGVGMVSFFKTT